MKTETVLNILSDGKYHSGTELGERIGVSRTAIWKILKKLEGLNISIEKKKGLGYRIAGGLDLLTRAGIHSFVADDVFLELDLFFQIPSTNDYLMGLKQLNKNAMRVCVTESQTSGRGRRGREWCSPFAKNIYMSIAFEIEETKNPVEGLSLVVGLSVAKCLESMGLEGVGLKWPNDIIYRDKKLAGILIELSGEPFSAWKIVVGIGLNVYMELKDGENINQPWISLNQCLVSNEKSYSRNQIVGSLINMLHHDIECYIANGFKAFVDDWNKFDALRGYNVEIVGPGIIGTARGVDEKGALRVAQDEGVITVHSGEVSIRKYEA